MKKIFILLFLLLSVNVFAQKKYEANWESIDSRPVPGWFENAKFGIFIHWGIYSVPCFEKVGEYSEWYWNRLVNQRQGNAKRTEVLDFHNKVYGKNFTYPQFTGEFNCELFNPEQWADIFKRSGAKYIVLTSKHHDGYCLWPSKDADRSWGRPWNSTETGPMRDLLGDLTTSVRNAGIKMGIYYSIYEWFNPLYVCNVDEYVDKHLFPQFKDVVTKYKPSIIFTDGEWGQSADTWKSTKLLSWLFNESPCKDSVVINDRWGKETRHHHGGYYTTEYGSGLSTSNKPWEECRGIGYSFGYNRAEPLEAYTSVQKLVYMLVDIVSRGGNLLLDIGPTADGRIPVIMQQRLLGIGDWLKVNSEAIYNTHSWTKTCQWSKGEMPEEKRSEFKEKYNIMNLTVSPEKGMARKEIFFTQKGSDIYAICPVYPKKTITINDLTLSEGSKVSMLGYDKPLKWKQKGKNVVINVPYLTASEVPCNYAWTFKLTNCK